MSRDGSHSHAGQDALENENEVCHASEMLQNKAVVEVRTSLYLLCGELLKNKRCTQVELQVALADVITHTACHIADKEK